MKVKKESRIFYAPQLIAQLGEWRLNNNESHHLIKVLRLKEGRTVHVVNGNGLLVQAKITDASKKECVLEIENILKERDSESFLTIAISPTKNIDRFEWFLEKATEIGVRTIIPFTCENSERKVIKEERLDKIIVSAMKQSGRLWKPELKPLCSFEHMMKNRSKGDWFIAHCHDIDKVSNFEEAKPQISVLIGPEGGFTEKELDLAFKNNCKGLHLGEFRLRSETAGIVACQLYNQSFP